MEQTADPASTLATRFAAGPQPPRQVLLWGAEIADALAAIHAAGQVHRGLRPTNVALEGPDASPSVRLLGEPVPGDAPVTPPDDAAARYAPPEAWRGVHEPSGDLYQLGLLLHEGLRGKPCFTGPPADVTRAHLFRDPPALSGVDSAVADTIMRLLGTVPSARPQRAAEVAATLRVLANTAPDEGYWPAAQTNAPSIVGKVWLLTTLSLLLVLAGILISSKLGKWDLPGSRVVDAPPVVFPQSTASGWILPPAAAASVASAEAARKAAAASATSDPARLGEKNRE